MRKRRIIALALVAMMSVSLAAFNQATKPAAKVTTLSTHICLKAGTSTCKHNTSFTKEYGEWVLVSCEKIPGGTSVYLKTYERTVTETCKKCGNVKTYKETKTCLSVFFGLWDLV